jgi:hypothetical protein
MLDVDVVVRLQDGKLPSGPVLLMNGGGVLGRAVGVA